METLQIISIVAGIIFGYIAVHYGIKSYNLSKKVVLQQKVLTTQELSMSLFENQLVDEYYFGIPFDNTSDVIVPFKFELMNKNTIGAKNLQIYIRSSSGIIKKEFIKVEMIKASFNEVKSEIFSDSGGLSTVGMQLGTLYPNSRYPIHFEVVIGNSSANIIHHKISITWMIENMDSSVKDINVFFINTDQVSLTDYFKSKSNTLKTEYQESIIGINGLGRIMLKIGILPKVYRGFKRVKVIEATNPLGFLNTNPDIRKVDHITLYDGVYYETGVTIIPMMGIRLGVKF